MTTQITARLADESVRHADRLVSEGSFPSRAAYLNWLVRRDMMLRRSLDDLRKIAPGRGEPYAELAGRAEATAGTPLDVD